MSEKHRCPNCNVDIERTGSIVRKVSSLEIYGFNGKQIEVMADELMYAHEFLCAQCDICLDEYIEENNLY